jgi:hypothetical protein
VSSRNPAAITKNARLAMRRTRFSTAANPLFASGETASDITNDPVKAHMTAHEEEVPGPSARGHPAFRTVIPRGHHVGCSTSFESVERACHLGQQW